LGLLITVKPPALRGRYDWRDKITNYFIGRETSGFVEGLNNKIKVIKRRCYGIYNLGRLFQHIWLDVQGRRLLFAKH
jgi:transposase